MCKNKLTQTLTKGLRLLFIVALATGVTLAVAPVPVAHAATITVNSNADNTTAGDGNCTLREAINNANADADTTGGDCAAGTGADTITLQANTTYTLTIVGQENANVSGDLDITDDLTINGAGAGSTIIDGNGTTTNDHVFHIDPAGSGGLTVNISGVTIQNGNVPAGYAGGGIYNWGGTVTITDSTLSGNQATDYGGGIYNTSSGTVTIANSTLSGNTADDEGGGIFNWGTVTITDSTLSGNTADDDGGGIYNYQGTVNITDSTLSGNEATDDGGGIYNYQGTVNITDSTLSGNQATGGAANPHGGGIFNDGGTVTITNSTLSANQADSAGGGIFSGGIGSTVTITNSTLSGNQAAWHGGGIHNLNTLTIANSTLSGNTADFSGGGIYQWSNTTRLNNVTITGNTADNDNDNIGDGGGIYHDTGAVNLKNTIIAANSDGTLVGNVHPDCSGALTSQDYNLGGDDTGCTIVPQTNDQIGTGGSPIDPLLGPLADNGGDTQTHALLAGSPAIDKGSCTDSGGNPVTTDQRGVARPQGAACDVGAYEAQPNLSIGKTVVPTTGVAYRGVVTYTVVLSNSGAGHAIGILLTDTLPVEVDFATWVEQPAGANVASDQITWSGGTVSGGTAITFTFVVTHTGNYGDVVTNTAEYSHTIRGSDYVTFTVIVTPTSYLPLIQTNNVITP